VLLLLLDEPFDQPMCAQERRYFPSASWDARARLGPFDVGVVDDFGHGDGVIKECAWNVKTAGILVANAVPAHRPAADRLSPLRIGHGTCADGIRARIVATRPARYADSGLRSKTRGAGAIAASRAACSAVS
jgi:hypothetical protein